jgi:Ca2+-binding RTX toxin-like protein
MGGNGNDTIIGGQGNDIIYGRGGGAFTTRDDDTFVWRRGDAGSFDALDIIRDFGGNTSGLSNNATLGIDKLDISQLLQDYTSGTSNLNQWVTVVNNQSGSTLPGVISGSFDATQTGALITIDVDGPGSGAVAQRIFLEGVTFNTTDPIQLRTNGVIVA